MPHDHDLLILSQSVFKGAYNRLIAGGLRYLTFVILSSGLFVNTGLVSASAEGTDLLQSYSTSLTPDKAFLQQRQDYLDAKIALRQGKVQAYQQLRKKLDSYPLVVYLDFYALNRRLYLLPHEDIKEFLGNHADTHLAPKLRGRWLKLLAKKRLWSHFNQFYDPDIASTKLQCQSLLARYHTGDTTALQETEHLWNVDVSQPSECDPLFKLWEDKGLLTQALVWDRFQKTIQARRTSLARYLAKKLEGEYAQTAQLYLEIHRHPQKISEHDRFASQTPDMQTIILHGVQRLARRDSLKAVTEWEKYDAQQLFADEPRRQTQQLLAVELVKDGHQHAADRLLTQIPNFDNEQVTESLVREALKQQDWPRVYQHITQLPKSEQQTERWLYWRARAMQEADISDPILGLPKTIYEKIATERSYYGFMAADHLGNHYNLGDVPAEINRDAMRQVINHPSCRRAQELRAINDNLNANREWYYMSQQFSREEEFIAAAKLADQWGWHHKSIMSMASAKYWDDLELRFPLPYNEPMLAAAKRFQISPLLLYSVARQESAFAESARSPAGAMGLMQLMPTTAKSTARKAGLQYRKTDLLNPGKNIQLGSFYLTELLQRYQGNRVLALAAYNAGPYRVDGWLKQSSNNLPPDVWIEVIPFRETRKYVQNILAYSVIYGYRTGTIPPLLNNEESNRTL